MQSGARIKRVLGLAVMLLCAHSARAELVVIVHAGSPVEHLERHDVINIFMGRFRQFPDGAPAVPLDVAGESPERREFYRKLLAKTLAEINAYWARLLFSGRTLPPRGLPDQARVLDQVAADPAAIGYADRKNLDSRVKIVYELPE